MGSPEFIQAIVSTTLLPFGKPATLTGDHRTMIINFDSRILLGSDQHLQTFRQICGINSHSLPTVTKFCKLVIQECKQSQLSKCITKLKQSEQLLEADHNTMDMINNKLTKILVSADHKCQKYSQFPWSPTLHKAFL